MSILEILLLGDAFFDAFEGLFKVPDFVGELSFGVVDDTAGLVDNGEDSIFSL